MGRKHREPERYFDQSNQDLSDDPTNNRLKGSKQRTIKFHKCPDEELRPWISGAARDGGSVKVWDRAFPFTKNGFITPQGWFIQCDAFAHSRTASVLFGCTDNYLVDKMGWVLVWDFTSIFDKSLVPYLRWATSDGLTSEQQMTMLKWCEGQKVSLKRATGYNFEAFHEKPRRKPTSDKERVR